MVVFSVGMARAQTTLSAEEKLERDFTDPLSTLPQLIIRDGYTPANYGPGPCTSQVCLRNYETNQLLVRPLIPRIPPEVFTAFFAIDPPNICTSNRAKLPRWNAY